MSNELMVAHCPSCGKIFQKNLRNLCSNCSTEEDTILNLIDKTLMRNRHLNLDELVEAIEIPRVRILAWIRSGKIKLFDYPNLADECNVCGGPIRRGTLCTKCTMKIQNDIAHALEQERLLKERIKAHTYIARS